MTFAEAKPERRRVKKALLALLILTLAAALGWWLTASGPNFTSGGSATSNPLPAPEHIDPLNEDPAQIEAEQRLANAAVLQQIGTAPLAGPVQERPEFVSRVEWFVLHRVAAQAAEPDKELTRLVNHLRFAKQLETWRTATGTDEVPREALAQQLLEDIPYYVQTKDLGRQRAQQIQAEVIASLYSNPAEQRERLAEEAERIGVEFDFQASGGAPPNS